MRSFCAVLAIYLMTMGSAFAEGNGMHDFDFLMGDWHLKHRVLRPAEPGGWLQFEGTC